jgi:two-component system NtrC family sensor kinase
MSTGDDMARNRRILIVDDQESIHDDFRKILGGRPWGEALDEIEAFLFDVPASAEEVECFEVDSAHQGAEGLARVQESLQEGRPYALAFVDVRMPPGWDGIETIEDSGRDLHGVLRLLGQ